MPLEDISLKHEERPRWYWIMPESDFRHVRREQAARTGHIPDLLLWEGLDYGTGVPRPMLSDRRIRLARRKGEWRSYTGSQGGITLGEVEFLGEGDASP